MHEDAGAQTNSAAVAVFADWLITHTDPPNETGLLANTMDQLISSDRTIVRVDQVAERLGTSIRGIQRLAQNCFGLPPLSIIRRYRLQEAARRLREEPLLTIAEVAAELGYADHAHLSTVGTRGARNAPADTATGDEVVDGGPALFRLVRFWSRRWSNQVFTQITRAADAESRRVQHIQVVEAVAGALRAGEEVTVTDVAEQLGLDHSGASRMVRDAVAAGYLARGGSARDRRRVVMQLTSSGQEVLTESRDWQRRCFDQLTAAWNEHDRHQFAGYLHRLANETFQ